MSELQQLSFDYSENRKIMKKLVIVKEVEPVFYKNGGYTKRRRMFLFKCFCGKEFVRRGDYEAKSCGCTITHGLSKNPLYSVWLSMHSRCYDSSQWGYKNYGGRGIGVCNRWHNIKNFISDMGDSYRPGLEIDRIDNNMGYSHENCRWATRIEQARNSSRNRLVEYNGHICPLSELCERYNLNYSMVRHRLDRGWDAKRAVEEPLNKWALHKTKKTNATVF